MKLKKLHLHRFRLPAGVHSIELDFGPDAVFWLDVREFLGTVRPSHRGDAPAGLLSIAIASPALVSPKAKRPPTLSLPVSEQPKKRRRLKGGQV